MRGVSLEFQAVCSGVRCILPCMRRSSLRFRKKKRGKIGFKPFSKIPSKLTTKAQLLPSQSKILLALKIQTAKYFQQAREVIGNIILLASTMTTARGCSLTSIFQTKETHLSGSRCPSSKDKGYSAQGPLFKSLRRRKARGIKG